MNGNIYLVLALALALGFLIRFVLVYLKTKQEYVETETQKVIWQHAPELIAEAEEAYAMVEKAGQQKMQMCIDALLPLIPDAVSALFTGDVIRGIVQTVFNSMKDFADFSIDEAARKLAGKAVPAAKSPAPEPEPQKEISESEGSET